MLEAPGCVDEAEEQLEPFPGVGEVAQGATRAAKEDGDVRARNGAGEAVQEVVRDGLRGIAASWAGRGGCSADGHNLVKCKTGRSQVMVHNVLHNS